MSGQLGVYYLLTDGECYICPRTACLFFTQEVFIIFCRYPLSIRLIFSLFYFYFLSHEQQSLYFQTTRKAALVDPDVTGLMDGFEPAAATTCLFQSPIVWHSVITVYVASQQAVSCVCYPFAHKRKMIHRKKSMFPLSQHVSFHRVKLPSLSYSIIHVLSCSTCRMGNVWVAWQHISKME